MKLFKKILSLIFISTAVINANVIKVNSLDQLQSLISNNAHVIIKFFANYCSPCKGFAPVYNSISNESTFNSIIFAEVNIQTASDIARAFNVKSIPTIIFVQNGAQKLTRKGTMGANEFKSLIKSQFSL